MLYPEKEVKLKKRKKHSAKPAKPAKKEAVKKEPASAVQAVQKEAPKAASSSSSFNRKLALFLVIVAIIALVSAVFILIGAKKPGSDSAKPDIIEQMENQPTPPIDDLEEQIAEIENEEPVPEIKDVAAATGECAEVSWELMSLSGQSYCILEQTGFDTFKFAVQRTGDRSIDEISVKMYGQGGDSVVSTIGEVDLAKGVTKKLGAFYSSESRGRLWKVELTPKTLGSDGITMIECTTLTLLIDASTLASKEIPYCI